MAEPINILIIGSGGREHTLAWKMAQSSLCKTIFISPGNAGTENIGNNISLDLSDHDNFKVVCLKEEIGLIVIGPEVPLVDGLYDRCKADDDLKNIPFIGPSKAGAQLEGSKAFAKEFMSQYGIPTAAYQEFSLATLENGYSFLESLSAPYVLKADGLAAGKGVLILDDLDEAKTQLKSMLSGKFGQASSRVVIEEFLDGIEFSVFALTDGKDYVLLPEAKDYKRIGEGDTGLNTGGMGAVSPVPFVDTAMMEKVIERVVKPTIDGINDRGFDYFGFVFIGLISVKGEPKVIEYNCRLGDPETEVILPRLETDLVKLFLNTYHHRLSDQSIKTNPQTATTVMMVSGGYPEAYQKGKVISGIESVKDTLVFHAGTKIVDDQVVTNGGRVLALTSMGNDISDCVSNSLASAEKIHFDNKFFRTDIGKDLL